MSGQMNLPQGWQLKKIGEVCSLLNGRAYKKEELLEAGPTPVLRVGNFFSNRGWYFSDLELEDDKYCDNGDLLYAWSASFGPKIWDGTRVIYHYHIWKVIPRETILKSFLFWFLEFDTEQIKAGSRGVGMLHMTKGEMEKRLIPIPPPHTQQKIVSKIDAAFTLLDEAIERQKQNIQRVEDLKRAVLEEVFDGEHKWTMAPLVTITNINPKFSTPVTDESISVSFIPMRCVDEESGNIDLSEVRTYSEVKKGFTPFENGDVIFAKITPCMENGKIAIVDNLENGKGFGSTEFFVFRCFPKLFNKFLFYFLLRSVIRSEAKRNFAGAVGQQRVPKSFLERLEIPLPKTIAEQQKIVAQIDHTFAKADEFLNAQWARLRHLEELKKSILSEAFRGQL